MTGGVVVIGETMGLFRAVEPGGLAHQHEFRLGIGGAESNVAIGVARLGGEATWIGRVGRDGVGQRVLRELRAEGVVVCSVVDDDARTGVMVKERTLTGSTRVSYYRAGSAGSRLSRSDVDPKTLEAAALLHVTGITPALSASAADAVRFAVAVAKAAGVVVSFDVNHRSALWSTGDAAPIYRELASAADVVFAGEDEAAILVGPGSALELAEQIHALGPRQVLIKRGAEGCLTLIDGEVASVPAAHVEVVDTVGAGDAFVAGYLAELVRGEPPRTRVATAVAAGAFACLGPGDWESYPDRAELALLSENRGDPVVR